MASITRFSSRDYKAYFEGISKEECQQNWISLLKTSNSPGFTAFKISNSPLKKKLTLIFNDQVRELNPMIEKCDDEKKRTLEDDLARTNSIMEEFIAVENWVRQEKDELSLEGRNFVKLSEEPSYTGVFGIPIRLLAKCESMSAIEATFQPGQYSSSIYLRTTTCMINFINGEGELWKERLDSRSDAIESIKGPLTSVIIQREECFQIKASDNTELQAILTFTPPWPGTKEAYPGPYSKW